MQIDTAGMDEEDVMDLTEVGILFKDSAGRYWHRNENGSLNELTHPEYHEIAQRLVDNFSGKRDMRIRFDK